MVERNARVKTFQLAELYVSQLSLHSFLARHCGKCLLVSPADRTCSAFVRIVILTCITCGRCFDDELEGSHEICYCSVCVVAIEGFCCRRTLRTSLFETKNRNAENRMFLPDLGPVRAHNFPDTVDGHSHIHGERGES